MADISAAQKGERYARVFRKAGVFIGKGDLARALDTLKEGMQLAQSLGDLRMARRFTDEITRLKWQRRDPPQ